MQYFRASIACPCGNPLFELGEPRSFLAVKLFVADSDKTPEPREGGPKKRLSLLAVCAAVTQMRRDLTERRAKQAMGGGVRGAQYACEVKIMFCWEEGGKKWGESVTFGDRKQVYERKVLSLETHVFIYTVEHLVTTWPKPSCLYGSLRNWAKEGQGLVTLVSTGAYMAECLG